MASYQVTELLGDGISAELSKSLHTIIDAIPVKLEIEPIDMSLEARRKDAKAVYARFKERGRMMPDGLSFVASWVAADLGRCFQVMECDDVTLLQRWCAAWSDLVAFEIVPVTEGKATAAALG